MIFVLQGANLREIEIPEGAEIVTSGGEDIRARIAKSISGDPETLVCFIEPETTYDKDYLKLLVHGLVMSRDRGVVANLAAFDLVDSRGDVFAYSFIWSLANGCPEQTPLSAYLILCSAVISASGGGSIDYRRLQCEIIPSILQKQKTEFIDLAAGLFSFEGRGDRNITNVYRSSIKGWWDVRTRPYARRVLRRRSPGALFGLARGLLARRAERKAAPGN